LTLVTGVTELLFAALIVLTALAAPLLGGRRRR